MDRVDKLTLEKESLEIYDEISGKPILPFENFNFMKPENNLFFIEYMHHSMCDFRKFKSFITKVFRLEKNKNIRGLDFGIKYFLSEFKDFCKLEIQKDQLIIYQVWCWHEWIDMVKKLSAFVNGNLNYNFNSLSSNYQLSLPSEITPEYKAEILVNFLIISGKIIKKSEEDFKCFFSLESEAQKRKIVEVILSVLNDQLYRFWMTIRHVKEDLNAI